jgi:AraC family transcriptional regulator of adaptative response/methylated-DNA-[protein]-cysteine methyltransferase
LSFLNGGGWDAAVAQLRREWPAATLAEDARVTAALAQRIFDAGETNQEQTGAPLRLLVKGTNFQVKVWSALLQIPPGALCTYSDVARAVERPAAARAVGGAVGANPIAYLIPCHRVIRAGGLVRDYRWGTTRKKAMLGWEAAHKTAHKTVDKVTAIA